MRSASGSTTSPMVTISISSAKAGSIRSATLIITRSSDRWTDLDSATLEDTKGIFSPNGIRLRISPSPLRGDFEPAEARELVETYFGEIPAGDVQPERIVPGCRPD